MNIKDIDHLTIKIHHEKINSMMRFYHEVFDLPVIKETDDSLELQLGHQKLIFNVHGTSNGIAANNSQSSSAQFCVIAKDSLEYVANHLANYGVEIIKGPIKTNGANGKMNAIYVNDPDGNVIEICEYER